MVSIQVGLAFVFRVGIFNAHSFSGVYRMDATLSEIITHLQRKNRKIRRSGTIIKFQIVFPDPARPRFRARDIGTVKVDTKGPDDLKTLSQCR